MQFWCRFRFFFFAQIFNFFVLTRQGLLLVENWNAILDKFLCMFSEESVKIQILQLLFNTYSLEQTDQ